MLHGGHDVHNNLSSRGTVTQLKAITPIMALWAQKNHDYPGNVGKSPVQFHKDLDVYLWSDTGKITPDGKGYKAPNKSGAFLPANTPFIMYEGSLGYSDGPLVTKSIEFIGKNGKPVAVLVNINDLKSKDLDTLGSAQQALANLGADTPKTESGITDKQFSFWTFVAASVTALALGTGVGYVISHRHKTA